MGSPCWCGRRPKPRQARGHHAPSVAASWRALIEDAVEAGVPVRRATAALAAAGDVGADAGVVDQHIEAGLAREDLLGQRADGAQGREVGLVGAHPVGAAARGDLGLGLGDPLGIAPVDQDRGAGGGKLAGQCPAEAVGRAGHQDGLLAEVDRGHALQSVLRQRPRQRLITIVRSLSGLTNGSKHPTTTGARRSRRRPSRPSAR